MGKTIHGMSGTPTHAVWLAMLQRCTDPKCANYPRYGGRGIKVCERWKSFANFIEDMDVRPSRFHQIDRMDNNGDYAPGNCRWSTAREQANNRRSNRLISFAGETRTLFQWAEHIGLKPRTLWARIKAGTPLAIALHAPLSNNRKKLAV